jgi:hypothetical protein|nr:MAG TPA: hypothetical protein [Caudoviricetes sp.]
MAERKMARKPRSVTAAPEVTKTSDKVVVCLNSAHSIIFEANGKKIKINGQNENLRGEKEGILAVGKFGQSIIDRKDWEEIVRIYRNMMIFRSGLIFAMNDTASANAKAKECEDMRHGLEPVDTSKTATKQDEAK